MKKYWITAGLLASTTMILPTLAQEQHTSITGTRPSDEEQTSSAASVSTDGENSVWDPDVWGTSSSSSMKAEVPSSESAAADEASSAATSVEGVTETNAQEQGGQVPVGLPATGGGGMANR